jgi:phytoene/squalene synthetase
LPATFPRRRRPRKVEQKQYGSREVPSSWTRPFVCTPAAWQMIIRLIRDEKDPDAELAAVFACSRATRLFDELDQYTFMVAGCVGEFWTKMTYTHMPDPLKDRPETMLTRGIRFGKALQMTNVLRDCGKDLRIGRCYLPLTMLDRFGLSPQELLLPTISLRARPVMYELVGKALDHFREAIEYTVAIPASSVRLRLACL